ncbi:MAG: EI24 domain-containing protein [Crocinitomicaceae bacterium]
MQVLKSMAFGFKSYWKAIKFMIEYRFYWYLGIPAVLMLFIYWIGAEIQSHKFVPQTETINEVIWYMLYLLIEITIAILLMKFAKYLVVALLSPLLAKLSEKTENILTGNKYPWSFSQLLNDVKRAMRIIVRNLMWEYFFFLIILIVSFIGWEDPTSSPIFYLTFVIGFYYYGFAFMDYINERRRLSMDQSIAFMRKNRGLAIVIGGVYSILILVPVDISVLFNFSAFGEDFGAALGNFLLNLFLWICASTAPILAIIAATIAMDDLVDLSTNEYSIHEDDESLEEE